MWRDSMFSSFKEDSVINGKRVPFAFRVLSEEEYEFAKRCVNDRLIQHGGVVLAPIPWLPSGSIQVHFITYQNENIVGAIYNENREEEQDPE